MKKYALASAAVMALAVPASAQEYDWEPVEGGGMTRDEIGAMVDAYLDRADADRDGMISRDEAARARGEVRVRRGDRRAAAPDDRGARWGARSDDRFARLDVDGDGTISRAEFDARAQARVERRVERQVVGADEVQAVEPEPAAAPAPEGDGLDEWDRDGDGAITWNEAMAPAVEHFDAKDLDRDGILTREERDRPQSR